VGAVLLMTGASVPRMVKYAALTVFLWGGAAFLVWIWVGVLRAANRATAECRLHGQDTTFAALAQVCVVLGVIFVGYMYLTGWLPLWLATTRDIL